MKKYYNVAGISRYLGVDHHKMAWFESRGHLRHDAETVNGFHLYSEELATKFKRQFHPVKKTLKKDLLNSSYKKDLLNSS